MTIPPPPAIPVKISALPAVSSVAPTDLIPVVQSGVTSRATAAQIASGGLVPTGVTAGTYGTASQVGQFTVNAQGLLTSASDIAIAIAASQVTSGQLALARGGTGADLSATGGANQVVRQSSVGGSFTVSTLANADIPTALTGKTYNGLTITSTTGTLTIPNGATLALSGAFSTTLTATNTTNVTLPTTGTLATLAGVEALSNKTITASAFNGSLGATTPSTAVVTTLNASGQITQATGASAALFQIGSNAGLARTIQISTGSLPRWNVFGSSDPESGANSGTNFGIARFNDAGSSLGTIFAILRNTGAIALGGTFGSESLSITQTASQNRSVTITGANGTSPTLGTSAGNLIIAPAGTEILRIVNAGGTILQSGTAIPAGGTAGLGYLFSSTANFGTFFGSGAPTLSAAKGSIYLRSDGSGINDRMYINTNGSTTWTAVVTVA